MNNLQRIESTIDACLQMQRQDKRLCSVRYVTYNPRCKSPIVWDGNYKDIDLIRKTKTREECLLSLPDGELLLQAYQRLIGNLVVIYHPKKNLNKTIVLSWQEIQEKSFKFVYKKLLT